MQSIGAVRELVGRYDAVLCDVWGVVHDGRTVTPGVGDALIELRAAGVPVVLLTNVPRPSGTVPAALARLGFPADAWDAIVTSGDAIREELARRAPGPMLLLGRDTDRDLWQGLGLGFVDDLDQAGFLAISALREVDETPQDYLPILRTARARDLELLCANPDVRIMSGGELRWCAGAVAEVYAALGGRVVQAGKPNAGIYDRAYEVVAAISGRAIPRGRILAIGDGPATDLLGANRQGMDALFIASGVHGDSLLDGDQVALPRAELLLDKAGVSATYVMPRLR